MDWKQYTIERRKTAIYPRKVALFYVLLMLVGEIGEVSAIAERADYNQAAVLGELGDVCWYIAALQYELGVESLDDLTPPKGWSDEVMLLGLFEGAAELQQIVAKSYRDADGVIDLPRKERMASVLGYLLSVVATLVVRAGGTLEGVLAANIAKLADRHARGVIGGSGDNR